MRRIGELVRDLPVTPGQASPGGRLVSVRRPRHPEWRVSPAKPVRGPTWTTTLDSLISRAAKRGRNPSPSCAQNVERKGVVGWNVVKGRTMRSCSTGYTAPRSRWFIGAVVAVIVLLGHGAPAAPAPTRPAGLAGSWRGTWKSGRSLAQGRFSATLSAKPAWWGDAEIVGTVEFGGTACFGALQVLGSYYREHEYLLTAKSPDGTIRVTSTVTVTNGAPRSLSGHYDVIPSGTACDSDAGRVDATAR